MTIDTTPKKKNKKKQTDKRAKSVEFQRKNVL